MDTVVKFVRGVDISFEKAVNKIVNEYLNKGYSISMISPVSGTEYHYKDPYGKQQTEIVYSQSFVFQKK